MTSQTRPRLLMLTTTLPARPGDGTPEFVLTLARALTTRYEITLLAPRTTGSIRRETVDGVRIERFAYFPRPFERLADGAILPAIRSNRWLAVQAPFLVLAFVVQAFRIARTWRAEVVNAHWIVPGGLVAWALRRALGVPYVVTAHGADAHALRPLAAVKKLVLSGASSAAPVSADIARALALTDADVVPMCVDVQEIVAATSPRAPERGRILFVGRLADKKGAHVLLRSLAQVPDATVVIVGDGPEQDRLDKLAGELGIADRVQMRGKQPRAQVLAELARAHALVIPSVVAVDGDRDGMPVVLAEGLAAGVPVIASDVGGIGEQVHDGVTGLLVPPGDEAALADAMRRSLDDPDGMSEIARRGQEWARARLDVAWMAGRYHDLLDRAVRRKAVP